MITNLSSFFRPEHEIFLDKISYDRIESPEAVNGEISLVCHDNVTVSHGDEGVKIVITRSLVFDPNILFVLSVSFGAILSFNENSSQINWDDVNLAEEFRENGDFVTNQLMSRISLMIGQITSSFGQRPIMLPSELIKNNPS